MLKTYALPTWLWAWMLLTAALGCKQDWSIPSQSQGEQSTDRDGGTADASQEAGTSEQSDAGRPRPSQNGERPNQAGKGGSSGSRAGAGAPAPAASGGSSGAAGGGAAGMGSDVDPREPCTTDSEVRCVGAGGQRERCDGEFFQATEACLADEVCEAGACVKVAAICQGSAGSHVCDGQGGLISCADNGSVLAQETCQSERHCQVGISAGRCPQCIPDEYRCEGARLDQCDRDGAAFATVTTCDNAALCKADSGACTDAACAADRYTCMNDELLRCNAAQTGFDPVMTCPAGLCDATRGACLACSAGSRSCDRDSNTALICDATGQNLTRNQCSAPRATCVGAGQCVECAVDTPCRQSTEPCRTSSCNLRTGSCEDERAMTGTGCSSSGRAGVCDAAGACVECLSEGDGRCAGARPHCTSAHTCVRCTQSDHCGFGEKCVNAECIAKCGDGVLDPGEDCERGYLSSSASNCDFATCKRLHYINCHDTAVMCPPSTLCLAAFYCLPTSDNNCVTSCPEVPGMTTRCSSGICYLDCTAATGGRCPADMHCENASPDGTGFITDMCFGNTQ